MNSANFYDVAIIGAGISGINAAYRIQTRHPPKTYTILEARASMGGTWDLFKYPGLRSDSDLHTFGYKWRPWDSHRTILDAGSILAYLKDCAAQFQIDQKIQYRHRLVEADWSSKSQVWSLVIWCTDTDPDNGGTSSSLRTTVLHCRWLIFASGYYDYEAPLSAVIPGIENFKGHVVHPQFWPEDLEYKGKDVVVIGSGATAVTLLPSIAKEASHVTMLQRTPTYIVSQPEYDNFAKVARQILPKTLALKLIRWKWVMLPHVFFRFCRAFPNAGRKLIQWDACRQLHDDVPIDPHFSPPYGPWEQRLCLCPSGDFYAAIKSKKASVVTGRIDQITGNEIRLEDSKQVLRPDIIVTATGLKMQVVGGAKLSIDGQPFHINTKCLWRGALIQDLPNAAAIIGYTNASWTLGADASMTVVTRVMSYMEAKKKSVVTPTVKGPLEQSRLLNLNSTYINAAENLLPKAGDRGSWKARDEYPKDVWKVKFASVTEELEYL